MFESAELGQKIDDATYDKQAKKLRPELLQAQYDLWTVRKKVSPKVKLLVTKKAA